MSFRGTVLALACWFVIGATFLRAEPPALFEKVRVETSSTSIYIGKVTLEVEPLTRAAGIFSGGYKAKVFPYFFMGEHGIFRMAVSDEELARLARGETVEFSGEAENAAREARKVTGRAIPANASSGTLKVRIFVTEKIQLIFNTTYRFEP
jgi:hypothetical protein